MTLTSQSKYYMSRFLEDLKKEFPGLYGACRSMFDYTIHKGDSPYGLTLIIAAYYKGKLIFERMYPL